MIPVHDEMDNSQDGAEDNATESVTRIDSDLDQPLSTQLAQRLIIRSPLCINTSCEFQEKTGDIFSTPNQFISFDLLYQRESWSERLENEASLLSPPNLGRFRNYNFLQPQHFESPTFSLCSRNELWNDPCDESLELFEKRVSVTKNQSIGTASLHIDPANPKLLVTPPSLEHVCYLLQSSRGQETLSPIKRFHISQPSTSSSTSSVLGCFPVSTRGGRGLRRSFISPLKSCSSFSSSLSTGLFFPSPPTSPNKEDSQRVKRMKLVFG
jgi:hypothetical protein